MKVRNRRRVIDRRRSLNLPSTPMLSTQEQNAHNVIEEDEDEAVSKVFYNVSYVLYSVSPCHVMPCTVFSCTVLSHPTLPFVIFITFLTPYRITFYFIAFYFFFRSWRWFSVEPELRLFWKVRNNQQITHYLIINQIVNFSINIFILSCIYLFFEIIQSFIPFL